MAREPRGACGGAGFLRRLLEDVGRPPESGAAAPPLWARAGRRGAASRAPGRQQDEPGGEHTEVHDRLRTRAFATRGAEILRRYVASMGGPISWADPSLESGRERRTWATARTTGSPSRTGTR